MSLATSNTGSCSEADQKEVDSTTVKALETQTFSEQVIHQLPRKTTQVLGNTHTIRGWTIFRHIFGATKWYIELYNSTLSPLVTYYQPAFCQPQLPGPQKRCIFALEAS